ncbi:MAG: site-specific integrase [Pseudomonadales bacterium]
MKAKLTATTLASLEPAAAPYDVRDTEIKGFLLRVLPTGAMTYFFQYRNEKGRQANYRIGPAKSLKPRQARDIAETLAGKVLSGVDIQAERKETRAKGATEKLQTWGGFLEHQFGPWVKQHRRQGEETLARLDANFGDLKARPLTEITAWVIEKWRAGRLKAGVSKSTLNRDVGDLKAALTKAVEWGLLDASPLASLRPFKLDEGAAIRYLTADEEKRLRSALEARDAVIKAKRANANAWRQERGYALFPDLSGSTYADYLSPMVLLAKNTGMRRGELFSLRWEDVNLGGKVLTVRGSKAKSGQTRHIPLNGEAVAILKAWQDQTSKEGAVFPSHTGEALTNVKNSWRGLLKKAGLIDFRFHDLRHDFASKLVMAGVPLNTVRDLLGHTDLKTTLRYAHLAPDHKAEAVNLIG